MYLGFSEVHILQGNLGRLANFFPMYLCFTWGGLVGLVWMSHWHHSLYSIVLCMDFFESSHVSASTECFHDIVLMYNHINSVTLTLPSPLSRPASTNNDPALSSLSLCFYLHVDRLNCRMFQARE